jgi:hypothetical protein
MIAPQETIMPITDILFLAITVCGFVTFAVALAWAEYQTRHLNRRDHQLRQQAQPQGDVVLIGWTTTDARKRTTVTGVDAAARR